MGAFVWVGRVAVVAVAIGLALLLQHELDTSNSETHCRMASEAESNRERFKAENHSAFVLGYTGEVGKALVKDLNDLKIFKKVVLIGRREVPLDVGPEIEQKVINMDNMEEHAEVFKDLDVGFCCLGTTRGKAGKAGFVKVDRDYVLNAAKISKAQGGKQFALVSSVGASDSSILLYAKTKGEAEEGCKEIGFDRLSIYRPGALLCDRQEARIGEKVSQVVMAPLFYMFPKSLSIKVEILARTMINHAVAPLGTGAAATTYTNKEIHEASGMKPGGCGN